MTLKELYAKLDMEGPADFEYFEQLADLVESEEDIPFDLFYSVLSQVSSETMTELAGNYMEEISEALPDGTDDLFSLVDSIQQRLLLLADSLEVPDNRRSFVEELYKFRDWYRKPGNASVDGEETSILDAVACAREEALGEPAHEYDFAKALDYDLAELSASLGRYGKVDVVGGDEEKEDEEERI